MKRYRNRELWPDDHGVHINAHGGGLLRHDGWIYWYGEHKIAGRAGNRAWVGVHVYRTRDYSSWEDRCSKSNAPPSAAGRKTPRRS